MHNTRIRTSRCRLRTSTSLTRFFETTTPRHNSLWAVVAPAMATFLGATLIALPSYAQVADANLSNPGDILDISNRGNYSVRTLNGIAGTSIILGANRLTTSSPDNGIYAGVISGTGGLSKNGTGMLTLTGENTYTGSTNIYDGTLALGIGGSLSASSRLVLFDTARFDISGSGSDQSISTLSGTAGTQILLGDHNLILNPLSPFDSFAGVISGAGGLIKNGAGGQTLTGNNTYTGDTVVNAGTLFIGAGGTTGSITGNLVNNASVFFFRSDDSTYGGAISGAGTLYKEGDGTLTLTGENTYTGRTIIYNGTLALGMGGSLSASSSFTLTDTGRLDITVPIKPSTP